MAEFFKGFSTRGWVGCSANFLSESKPQEGELKMKRNGYEIKPYANLRGADLQGADLRCADLQGANLDFSCLPLWCRSQNVITDKKQDKQILAHAFNIARKNWPGKLTKKQITWLNDFHQIQSKEFPKFV